MFGRRRRGWTEVFPQTPIVAAPADYVPTPPAALTGRPDLPVIGRPHGALVMDLFCALNDGEWEAADDATFIEDVARRLWTLGWRRP